MIDDVDDSMMVLLKNMEKVDWFGDEVHDSFCSVFGSES